MTGRRGTRRAMTWGEVAAFLTSIAALVAAGTGVFSVIVARRTAAVIKEVQHNTNSIVDRLVETTGEAAYQEGVADQKERDEQ